MITQADIDALMLGARSIPEPDTILVGAENYAVMRTVQRGIQEGWDRRRIKREARKGTRSKYRLTT